MNKTVDTMLNRGGAEDAVTRGTAKIHAVKYELQDLQMRPRTESRWLNWLWEAKVAPIDSVCHSPQSRRLHWTPPHPARSEESKVSANLCFLPLRVCDCCYNGDQFHWARWLWALLSCCTLWCTIFFAPAAPSLKSFGKCGVRIALFFMGGGGSLLSFVSRDSFCEGREENFMEANALSTTRVITLSACSRSRSSGWAVVEGLRRMWSLQQGLLLLENWFFSAVFSAKSEKSCCCHTFVLLLSFSWSQDNLKFHTIKGRAKWSWSNHHWPLKSDSSLL